MRLIAYRTEGRDGLALSRGDDLLDLGPITLQGVLEAGPEALAALDRQADRAPALDTRAIRHRPPLPRPPKIICVGLNYADHTKESPYQQPTYPTVFPRFASSLIGHGDPIRRPLCSVQLDYEGELVAVIGKTARNVSEADALSCVFGYCTGQDFSERDQQMRSGQWMLGKTGDGWGPIGPWLVTADQVDPENLNLKTTVNGEQRQSANTKDMIFSVRQIVSFASRYMTLQPGDLIFTGTPEGVIIGYPPEKRVWLKAGDKIISSIEKLGDLEFTLT